MAAGFIQEHEAPRVDPDGAGSPGLPRRLVPLAGAQGLFFGSSGRRTAQPRDQPAHRRAGDPHAGQLLVPGAVLRQCGIRGGFQAGRAAPPGAGRLGRGRAAARAGGQLPVSRRSARYRFTVARPPRTRARPRSGASPRRRPRRRATGDPRSRLACPEYRAWLNFPGRPLSDSKRAAYGPLQSCARAILGRRVRKLLPREHCHQECGEGGSARSHYQPGSQAPNHQRYSPTQPSGA